MNPLLQDIRFALRQLRKSPAFTVTVVLTLALGIGANTAVFTLFDQVLLRMLPVQHPQELVRFIWSGAFSGSASSFGGDTTNFFSYPMYKDLRDRNQVFSGVLAADRTSVGVSWHNQAEHKEAEMVSGNYFEILGLKPAAGRLLTQGDDTAPGANPVVVLSYGYWKAHFAGARDVIGLPLLINGHPFTILGVAPANFDSAIGGYRPGLFIPISMVATAMPWRAPLNDLSNHQSIWLTLVARLKPDVTPTQAQAGLAPLWHSLRAYELTLYKSPSPHFKHEFLDNSRLQVVNDSTGFNPSRIDLRTPLIILMSMAVLLVAMCAINVATLLLLRASARAREMSMRYALGAKRARIVSQLLVEGGLIGLAGATAGLALAPAVSIFLVRLMTNSDPGSEPYSTAIDMRVLLFTLAVSLITSLLFGIAPAFHFLRPDLAQTLRQNAGTATKRSQLFRKLAVGLQIGLSVLLLGCAGLFVRTLDNLRHQQVGFETANLITFDLDPSTSGYGEDRTPQTVLAAIDAVRRIPGVTAVGASTDAELSGNGDSSSFSVQGYKASEDEKLNFEEPWTTPGYFAALDQPLLAGRDFTLADGKGQPKSAIVNLMLAKRFYGSPQNALGRAIGEGGGTSKFDTTIVGVVGDVKHSDLRSKPEPTVYRAYLQQPHPGGVTIRLRSEQPSATIESSIRAAIHQLDPTLVVGNLETMDLDIENSAADERTLAFLAVGFSSLAMLLAAVGLYGVLAYATEQRTREIGVRLALGAQRWSVVGLIVREMSLIAGLAVMVAMPAVGALGSLVRSQLFGVTAFDPITLAAALGLTILMAMLAAALPARRAASVEPVRALRTE